MDKASPPADAGSFDADRIEKEIVVRTTPEAAFRALVSPEALRKWWVLFPNTALKFAAQTGGSYEMAGKNAAGGDWLLKGTVTACEPPRYLAYTWKSTWTETETLVEWWINDLGDGSVKIRLRHSGWSKEPHNRPPHEDGWDKVLAQLDDYLSGREVVNRLGV